MSTLPSPVYIKPVRQIVGLNYAGSSSTQSGPSGIAADSALKTTTIIADAVIEEQHEDEMVMTEHPVEQGAAITDHAYKLPSVIGLEYAWSAGSPQNTLKDVGDPLSFLKSIYQQILNLQVTRTLCTVTTGKRIYNNMLVQRVSESTARDTENSMILRVTMREIIIATTPAVLGISLAGVQQFPQQTGPVAGQGTQNLQPATNFNVGAIPAP